MTEMDGKMVYPQRKTAVKLKGGDGPFWSPRMWTDLEYNLLRYFADSNINDVCALKRFIQAYQF